MPASDHELIGASAAMARVNASIEKAAHSDFTVLIEGESGTGKELVARAIHTMSARNRQRLVAVNCAVTPKELIDNELFGHERGAFTGAHELMIGKFEQAHLGTLFLDEIGEMDFSVQAKLLRAIEESEFERLGGTKPVQVDFRLIAATNRNLRRAVAEGQFRKDLYFRLNVMLIRMPPLRERIEDVPALALHFISCFGMKSGRTVVGLTEEAVSMLCAYHWPGNVRELRNVIQRAIANGSSDFIEPADLQPEAFESAPGEINEMTMQEAIQDVKRRYMIKAVEASKGNRRQTAKLLNKHPKALPRMLDNLELSYLKRGKYL